MGERNRIKFYEYIFFISKILQYIFNVKIDELILYYFIFKNLFCIFKNILKLNLIY